jgi:stringent starvation protein B
MASVLGIYARETGQGMIFSHDSDNAENAEDADQSATQEADDIESTRARSHLRVIK